MEMKYKQQIMTQKMTLEAAHKREVGDMSSILVECWMSYYVHHVDGLSWGNVYDFERILDDIGCCYMICVDTCHD